MTLRINDQDSAGKRVDAWLANLPEVQAVNLSRTALKSLLEGGAVMVNGKPVKPSYLTRTGDIIELLLPEPAPLEIEAEDIPLDVVYEDLNIIVVNKPQGMVVHPAPGHYSGTLVNALLFRCGDTLSGINGVMRPGIVHRIDKDTSGLLAAAKTDTAHRSLSEQLAAHTVTRRYYAVACGRVAGQLTINVPIARHKTQRKKMAADSDGRRAVTRITPIRYMESKGIYTFLEAQLETGRTHQIRVHMAHINRPILGDTVYGSQNQPFKLNAQILHAGILGFKHPVSGDYMEFKSPLPPYFENILESLSN